MSQDFKLRYDQMRQSNPTKLDGDTVVKDCEYFDQSSNTRNLCFVWADNRMKFYNYAYLISGDYLPDDSSITLVFTTDIIVIKGARLLGLFDELLRHLPRKIVCVEERYRLSVDENMPIIDSIEIISST
jgi:hypothetical protein